MDRHQLTSYLLQQEGEVWSDSNFRLLAKNSRKSDPAGLKRLSAEILVDRTLMRSGNFDTTFLLESFESETQEDAHSSHHHRGDWH